MRPIWKGAISFGLVNIPITLYPATRREQAALMEVIEEKVAAGGKEVAKAKAKKSKGVKPTNVIDLVSVLQKSIQAHGSRRAKKATPQKARRKAA